MKKGMNERASYLNKKKCSYMVASCIFLPLTQSDNSIKFSLTQFNVLAALTHIIKKTFKNIASGSWRRKMTRALPEKITSEIFHLVYRCPTLVFGIFFWNGTGM